MIWWWWWCVNQKSFQDFDIFDDDDVNQKLFQDFDIIGDDDDVDDV